MVEPLRHRQTKEAGTDMFDPKATASHLDSTRRRSDADGVPCPMPTQWSLRLTLSPPGLHIPLLYGRRYVGNLDAQTSGWRVTSNGRSRWIELSGKWLYRDH